MIVTPSILEPNINRFVAQIKRLSPYYQRFQVDIQDGIYIENETVAIDQLLEYFGHTPYPFDQQIQFDFDLMVENPEKEIQKLASFSNMIKIENVLVHAKEIEDYEKLKRLNHQFKIGFSLSPPDTVEHLEKQYGLQNIPFVQIMTVAPGPQGQAFLPEMLNKIELLRRAYYRNEICLDGAISDKTLPVILAKPYKPDILAIGSFLTKTDKLKERVNYLTSHLRT